MDSGSHVITVVEGPVADFNYTPIPPVANEPVRFENKSVRAVTYLWEFGDNTEGTETNPIHQYNKTGTYRACLNAYNLSNCPSRLCKDVATEVVPIIGLPTAFSPNGDGENDILYVRGAAIKTVDLKIYNRWGQLVFRTKDNPLPWDGTYKGEKCPIGVYTYLIKADNDLFKGTVMIVR
jgi:gliding motility-associated-like protein